MTIGEGGSPRPSLATPGFGSEEGGARRRRMRPGAAASSAGGRAGAGEATGLLSLRRGLVAAAVVALAATFSSVVGIVPPSAAAYVSVPTAGGGARPAAARRPRGDSEAGTLAASFASRLGRDDRRGSGALHYADDSWIGTELELSRPPKLPSDPTNPRASSSSSSAFRRCLLSLRRLLFSLRETLRVRLERGTVYVLELENGKYYVGSTSDRKRRYKEHSRRRGARWTRAHKPLRVSKEYRRIPRRYVLGTESRVTAELMLDKGVNNVRGSMFCAKREYHKGDALALSKFLGHYCDLSYRKVNSKLCRTLPPTPGGGGGGGGRGGRGGRGWGNGGRRRNRGKRFACGEEGHFAAECPKVNGDAELRP